MNPSIAYLDAALQAEQTAQAAAGLFVGTFWLVVVLLGAWLALAIIDRRRDP